MRWWSELNKTVNYIYKNRTLLYLFLVYPSASFMLHQLLSYQLTHVQSYSCNHCHSADILVPAPFAAAAPSTTPASSQRPLYAAWLPDENWQSWGKCAEINDGQLQTMVLDHSASFYSIWQPKDQRRHSTFWLCRKFKTKIPQCGWTNNQNATRNDAEYTGRARVMLLQKIHPHTLSSSPLLKLFLWIKVPALWQKFYCFSTLH